MVVDVHTHTIPWPLVELIAGGDGPEGVGVEWQGDDDPLIVHDDGLRYPVPPVFHDVAAKLEQMDRDGIDVSVVSLSATLFLYGIDPAQTARMCRVVNDGAAIENVLPFGTSSATRARFRSPSSASAHRRMTIGRPGPGASSGPGRSAASRILKTISMRLAYRAPAGPETGKPAAEVRGYPRCSGELAGPMIVLALVTRGVA
jgi:aminocarboxymuconate-semialdehyde decarboxylase